MPIDYSNGKIYKIVSNHTNDVYIGSTCEPMLSRRLAQLRSEYRNYAGSKRRWMSYFAIVKYDDAQIFDRKLPM